MPKKQTAAAAKKKKGPSAKKGSSPKAAKKKVVKSSAAKPKKKAAKKTAKKAAPKAAKKSAPKKVLLGRPKVTGEEKLFMLFHDNYHARQIFQFLRVETVKELEEFTPQEIINRLSQPIQTTVQRIREELAAKNRCLAGDAEFAAQHQSDEPQKPKS